MHYSHKNGIIILQQLTKYTSNRKNGKLNKISYGFYLKKCNHCRKHSFN